MRDPGKGAKSTQPNYLAGITLHPGTAGMTFSMRIAVSKMIQDSGGRLWIESGFRSYDQQSALYQKYLNGTGNLAAKPGRSLHEHGLAVDFGGDLQWAAKNAAKYGLQATVRGEPWHFSLINANERSLHTTGHPRTVGGGAAPAGGGGTEGGGGGVSGGSADPGPPRLAANASEAEIVKFITENYGTLAVALLREPELRKALIDAARTGAVGERFMEFIHRTNWWKKRTVAQRQWDMLKMQDPQEVKDRLAKRVATLKPIWEQYGLNGNINEWALNMERLGLNEAQLQGAIAAQLTMESAGQGLDVGSTGAISADELQRIARMEYLTPIDRQTAERWAIRAIRTGEDIEEAFRNYLASLSAPRFGLDPKSGIAPADLMAPIKMTVADNLELNPDTIDLLDPEYAELMQVTTDQGGYRPMTVAEATRWARSQESFKGTKVAEKASSELAEMLGQTFGKVGAT